MPSRIRFRNRLSGVLVGTSATLVVCVLWACGALTTLTHIGEGLHFRLLNNTPSDPRILLIDIDDNALEGVHRWPWPRRLHAELVRVLDELGAKAIVLDIAFVDRSEPRIDPAALGPYWDVDQPREILGDLSDERLIYDDDELVAAIESAGNVYLAGFFEATARPKEVPVSAAAFEWLQADPDLTLRQVADQLGLDAEQVEEAYASARATLLFAADYEMSAAEAASQAGIKIDVEILTRAKRRAARLAARRYRQAHPDDDFHAFLAWVLPKAPPDAYSADRAELRRAFLAESSDRLLRDRWPVVSPSAKGQARVGYEPSLPIDKLAAVCRGVGFVNYERETVVGTVRASPFLIDYENKAVSSLGFLAACDQIGADWQSLKRKRRHIELQTEKGPLRVPVRPDGLTPINWHVPGIGSEWRDSFQHIPVTRVMEIVSNRRSIEENRRRIGLHQAELLRLRHAETPAEYLSYAQTVRERNDLQARLRRTGGDEERSAIHNRLRALGQLIEPAEREAEQWLAYQWSLWKDASPHSQEERDRRETMRALHERFNDGGTISNLRRLNARLQDENERLLTQLGGEVKGRICFVGYTATAVADFIPTPAYASMPGVMAHANMANMVLQDRFVVTAPGWVNILLVLLGGSLITVLASLRGPAFGLASLSIVLCLIVLLAGTVFWWATCQLDWLSAGAAVCVAWASVTLYRQATEEREKRRLRQALAHYTSPAVAARIAEQSHYHDLSPQPARVTCFFSDLKDFTILSRRLGPQATRGVLNSHLQSVSTVLTERGAMINKFLGDGIFAYFNAPIWPCPDHAQQACASALASLETIRSLSESEAVPADARPLVMRIGLSTGEVFVGDYGSDTKLDYTCIGDTVNLGSRLEAANKVLGTAILVDRATRDGADDRFVFRAVGRLRLAGMSASVEVSDPIGEPDRVELADYEFARRFEEAVGYFQQRDWDRCLAILERCDAPNPGDRTVEFYRSAAILFRQHPPPDDWDGSLTVEAK
ncbi:MAG: CHASE2 domain-containing protein [Phycisphaerales bacterium]|nr:MAG: CHASE2 domain-containing protein [Phycisphaerales bacterium]